MITTNLQYKPKIIKFFKKLIFILFFKAYSFSACLLCLLLFGFFELFKVFKNNHDLIIMIHIFFSISSNFKSISLWVLNISLIFKKTSIIRMLIFLALGLLCTCASCKIPCSVKTKGKYLWPPQLEVTICDLKFLNSFSDSSNIKCSGKISALRLTAYLSTFVSTSYNSAKSRPIITFCPLIINILLIITSSGSIIALLLFSVISILFIGSKNNHFNFRCRNLRYQVFIIGRFWGTN